MAQDKRGNESRRKTILNYRHHSERGKEGSAKYISVLRISCLITLHGGAGQPVRLFLRLGDEE